MIGDRRQGGGQRPLGITQSPPRLVQPGPRFAIRPQQPCQVGDASHVGAAGQRGQRVLRLGELPVRLRPRLLGGGAPGGQIGILPQQPLQVGHDRHRRQRHGVVPADIAPQPRAGLVRAGQPGLQPRQVICGPLRLPAQFGQRVDVGAERQPARVGVGQL